MTTDQDSFLQWGENDDDGTLHVIVAGHHPAYDDVLTARTALADCISPNCRLADYAVWTDPTDWSESQHVWLLDGTTTTGTTAP